MSVPAFQITEIPHRLLFITTAGDYESQKQCTLQTQLYWLPKSKIKNVGPHYIHDAHELRIHLWHWQSTQLQFGPHLQSFSAL